MARRNSRAESDFADIRTTESQDAFMWMSAERIASKDELDSSHASCQGVGLPPSYPLPLVLFVCLLSIIGGLVVTGVHYAILFSGCPLGLNGCNDFNPAKEQYGFFLIRALGDSIPEDLVYIFAAVAGGIVFAQMATRLPEHLGKQIMGGGTVQGLVAVASGLRISLPAAGLRLIASCVYLGTGGTLGMDGPAIQVCTAVTTFCGWVLGMRGVQTQSLLASLGFAAGFAASFNAPLAGIMFAMEELSHASPNLSQHIICIILMVSIVATAVARLSSGNNELFQTEWTEDLMNEVAGGSLNKVFGMHMWMLISIPIAIVCSLFGYLTSVLMGKLRRLTQHLQEHREVSFTALVVIATLLSSSIGSAVFRVTGLRGVWGIGYESLQKIFDDSYTVTDYFVFAAGKVLATAISLAVRAPGDLLEPVIIVGAFMGGGMGRILQEIVEDDLEQRVMQPCLVFGMVAFFASCFRFPLTPVLIVLEVTGVNTYTLVLPAALASFTAVTMSNRLYVPLLDSIMEEDGVSLHDLAEDAASSIDIQSREGDEPEPEEDGPSRSQSGVASEGESIATHSSTASNLRTVLRGVESSMLSLSISKSRSPSRSNSHASSRSAQGDIKFNTLSDPLRAPSRPASSGANSISNISLNVPISEQGHAHRAKNGLRLNTQASGGSSCGSSCYNSEAIAVPKVVVSAPRSSEETHMQSALDMLETRKVQGRSILDVRAELETMRKGALIRCAAAAGVDEDALDIAIEKSSQALVDLILGRMYSPKELDITKTNILKAIDEPVRVGKSHAIITADAGIDTSKVLIAKPFQEWVDTISKEKRIEVSRIHVQSLDMFGPEAGFIKFKADAKVDGKEVPGIVFMRGGAVAILVILEHEDKQFALLVRQPRVPVCSSCLAEIPAGMFDRDGMFVGVAAKEMKEETGIDIRENELIDMTNLAFRNESPGMFASCGGTDEFIRIFLYRKMVTAEQIQDLSGKLTGVLEEGEMIKLHIVPLDTLWRISPDAKALGALCLYRKLKDAGFLPKARPAAKSKAVSALFKGLQNGTVTKIVDHMEAAQQPDGTNAPNLGSSEKDSENLIGRLRETCAEDLRKASTSGALERSVRKLERASII